jgi:DNA modification methylase
LTTTKIKDYPVIELNVNDIKKDPTNPNTMTLEQERGLEKSIVKFGRLKHIVVDQDNVLIDGEHRLEVEKANGTQKVNVIQVNVKDEIERKMMRETLNKLHGTYNKEKESSELLQIFENQRLDELAELLAQPKQELENLISRYNPDIHFEREEDDTKLPSLYDTEAFVKRGEVWQLGRHRLMCGDSHNDIPVLLNENKKPDLLLTDPPYGISIVKSDRSTDGGSKPLTIAKKGYVGMAAPHKLYFKNKEGNSNNNNNKSIPCREYKPIIEDDTPFDPSEFIGLANNHVIFGGNYFSNKLPISVGWLVWLKKHEDWDRTTFSDCELIWTDFDIPCRIYSVIWFGLVREGDHSPRVHPTQKPTSLLTKLIKDFTQEHNIILDPFLGSGSTLIACEQTNRICYGMEIDEHYCSVIIKRWENYTGLKARKVN